MINYSLKSLSVALLSQQRYTVISRFDFYVTLQTIFLKFGIDIKNICQPGDVMVCFIGAFPQEIRLKKSKYRRALKYYLGHLYRKKKPSDVTGFHFHCVKDIIISEKILPIRKKYLQSL